MKQEPFVIERVFAASPEKLWKAITDKNEMKQWYFDLGEFRPEVGFTFRFEGGPDHKTYIHICEVTEVIPLKKLTYSWRYEGYEGISYVTWELFPEEKGTRLKLTHAGLETFPVSNPDLAPGNFAEGWKDIIGNQLRKYLDTAVSSV
jgi:uncharacterized protein YndB with AHSA1/START domain